MRRKVPCPKCDGLKWDSAKVCKNCVIPYDRYGEKNPKWRGGISKKFCVDCGTRIKNYYAKRCYPCRGKNQAVRQMGANSHLWKGGISTEKNLMRNRQEFVNWRKAVFERDNYTCQKCGFKSLWGKGELAADHILPVRYFPHYILDVNNGQTVCISCNNQLETHGQKVHKYYYSLLIT